MTGPALPPIGERLRQARLARGISVRGLARVVDVSASLISQIETGKSNPSVSTLYAITAALVSPLRTSSAISAPAPRAGAGAPADAGANGTRPAAGLPAAVGAGPAGALVAPRSPPRRRPRFIRVRGHSARPGGPAGAVRAERSGGSATTQGLRMLQRQRRVGPVVSPSEREVLHLDSGVTWELLGQLPDTHVDFLRITYAPGGSSSGVGVLMRHSGTEWGHVLAGQLTLTLGFDTYVLNPGDSVSFDCSTPHSYANHGIEPAVGVWFVAERFR